MVAALGPTSLPGLLIRACGVLGWARLWVPALFLLSTGFPYPTHAQVTTAITPSGTIGTVITQSGTTYNITGGTRPGGGPNLFHSFGQFSVGAGDTALFNNTTPALFTSNLLSRVTGGNPSNIFGTIDTITYPSANFWLINPAGVVFGPTASVNVAGSVNIATANYLRMADGARFYADLAQPSTLSMAPVAAFGFLTPTSARPIDIQGSVLDAAGVQPDQSFTFVGQERTVEPGVRMTGGRLQTTSDSQIKLVSVASEGEVLATAGDLSSDLGTATFANLGALVLDQARLVVGREDELLNNSGVFLIGGRVTLRNSSSIEAGGFFREGNLGGVVIHARNSLELSNSSILSQSRGSSISPSRGALVSLFAPALVMDGGRVDVNSISGLARSGDILVEVGSLELRNGATLLSNSEGGGRGGNIDLAVSGQATLTSGASVKSEVRGGENPGGNILLLADVLEMNGGARLSARTSSAADLNSTLDPTGGLIRVIATREVRLSGGALIEASSVRQLDPTSTIVDPIGDAGTITIASPLVRLENGAVISSATEGSGDAGSVTLNADSVILTTDAAIGGRISTSSTSTATGAGATGTITIQGLSGPASTVRVEGLSTLETSAQGVGQGGSILIRGRDVVLGPGASLSAQARIRGDAGNITILDAATINVASGVITTEAGEGQGGSITLDASGGSAITLTQALVRASVTSGGGSGGNIEVTAPRLTMLRGDFFAETAGTGQGGSIALNANTLDIAGTVLTTNTRGTGRAGSITIAGLGGPGTLPTTVSLTSSLLFSDAQGTGEGGAITIGASESVNLRGAVLTALVRDGVDVPGGNLGSIIITTPNLTMSSSQLATDAIGTRRAGNIELNARQLRLTDTILTSSAAATGVAGSIRVQGLGGPGTLPTDATLTDDSVVATFGFTTGEGGSISLGASSTLNLTSSLITAQVNNGVDIPGGQIGTISVTAPTVTMAGGSITAETTGSRRGGDITISAGNLSLGPGSTISAQSFGPGDAGSILLTSGNTILLNGGAVTTTAAQASGGAITLTAGYMTRLINSQITSSVEGGTATRGGDITLDPQFVILQNSQILAQAFQGNGGNITIVAGVLLADPNTVIDASSQLGVSGSVNLQAPIQNLSGALVPLRQPLVQVAMSGDRCAASPTGQMSSFVQAGRDGVPPEPGSFLSSPLPLEALEGPAPTPGRGPVKPPARLGQSLEPAAGLPVSASPLVLVAGCSS